MIKKESRIKKTIYSLVPWAIPVAVLLFWILYSKSGGLENSIFPTPEKVINAVKRMIKNGQLVEFTLISAKRAFSGFLIGGAIGFLLGLFNGLSDRCNHALDTTLQMFRTIPLLTLLPLIIMTVGIGEASKVVMVSISVFFSIYLNTRHGIRSVDKGLIEMGTVYGLNKVQLFINIIFPGALSSILVGVRQSLGSMWLILVAAESVATDSGIGYMIMNARELMMMELVILGIIVYAVLGKLSDVFAKLIERRFLRWNPEFQ